MNFQVTASQSAERIEKYILSLFRFIEYAEVTVPYLAGDKVGNKMFTVRNGDILDAGFQLEIHFAPYAAVCVEHKILS